MKKYAFTLTQIFNSFSFEMSLKLTGQDKGNFLETIQIGRNKYNIFIFYWEKFKWVLIFEKITN